MCSEYIPELLVIAGVEGVGKSSMRGALQHYKEIMETVLDEVEIRDIEEKHMQGTWICMYYIGLDAMEEHLSRIENRVRKGGASADPLDVKLQFDRRFESLVKVFPLCNEVFFFDNENGFRCVGHYCDKMIVEKKSCQWFLEYLARYYIHAGSGITDDEKIDIAAQHILKRYHRAFEELAQ